MTRNYKIDQNGIDLIKQFEGCRLTSYKDVAGIWTIGYGWTGSVNGSTLREGIKITQEEAENLLVQGLESFIKGVNDNLTVDVTQNQFNALVSLCYNIGVNAFKSSTLLRKLNAGDITGASNQFLVWNKVEHNVVQGLVNRREKEKALFDSKSETANSNTNTQDFSIENKTLEQLATEVLNGEVGTGNDRKEKLGEYYDSVQAIVNHRLKVFSGNETINSLIKQVRLGKLKNGDERKFLLGSYYNPVQDKINGK